MTQSKNLGRVVWRELMTDDTDRARGFFGELCGWKFEEMQMGDTKYTIVKLGDRGIGGLMKKPMPDVPTHFLSYVSVANVDDVSKLAAAEGGKVIVPPTKIPDVGRFCIFVDFAGAAIAALQGDSEGPPPPERPGLGEFCWETLSTSDTNKAKAFYSKVFGWKAHDNMGPDMLVLGPESGPVADVQKAENMPPNWLTYVVVEKLEAANQRVEKLGGKVLMPLIEVPKVGRISAVQEPTGAVLGLFQPMM
ncbi:MAG: VOC family protein [Polyangiaceae bacterium]